MSLAETHEIGEVWDRINVWSPTQKIALMRKILDSLEDGSPTPVPLAESEWGQSAARSPGLPERDRTQATGSNQPPKKTLADFLGAFQTDGPPPTDEEVQRILEEERMRKSG